jgi:hypothetical protein
LLTQTDTSHQLSAPLSSPHPSLRCAQVFDAHKKGKKRLSPVCDFESWSTKAAAHFLYVKWDAQHSVHDLYNREKKPQQKCLVRIGPSLTRRAVPCLAHGGGASASGEDDPYI